MSIFRSIYNNRENIIKKLLLCFILAPFFVFFIQQKRHIISLKSLEGYFTKATYSPISLSSWISGDYQENANNYFNEGFGFRSVFVRINNELSFLLFKKTQVYGVILGKNNQLFEYGYITALRGEEFLGDKALTDTISKIKLLQDTLKSLNKHLLIVLAPNKARVYSEYLPDSITIDPDTKTNYDGFKNGFKKRGVDHIDFNALFEKKKSSSPYLLNPQLGIHWSALEAVRAADTIINFLSSVSSYQLPKIKINNIYSPDTLQWPDDDIARSMNLMFYPKHLKMGYPDYEIVKSENAKRNILVVSDSYWWQIYIQNIPLRAFANNEFWYYNKEIWGNNHVGKIDPKDVDIKRRILQSDYIVIVATESNYAQLGYGFIGEAMAALRRNIIPSEKELEEIKHVMANNKVWSQQIYEKAKQRKISIEEMTTEDANWYFQNHGPIKKEISVEEVKTMISSVPEWIAEIRKKAEERKLSVDSVLTESAIWHMKNVLNVVPSKKQEVLALEKVKEKIVNNYQWMEQIREKAKKRGVSVDSMICMDARWYLEQQKAKN